MIPILIVILLLLYIYQTIFLKIPFCLEGGNNNKHVYTILLNNYNNTVKMKTVYLELLSAVLNPIGYVFTIPTMTSACKNLYRKIAENLYFIVNGMILFYHEKQEKQHQVRVSKFYYYKKNYGIIINFC